MVLVRKVLGVVGAVALVLLALLGAAWLVTQVVNHPRGTAELSGLVVAGALVVLVVLGRLVPRVPRRTVLELDLAVPPPEAAPSGPLAAAGPLSGRAPRPLTLRETVTALERASRDRRVVGLVMNLRLAQAPWSTLQELRDAILAFRAAPARAAPARAGTGRFTVAFADSFGDGGPANGAYYLATACEEIVLQPGGEVGWMGLGADVNFYKNTLAKLGATVEAEGRHEYKTAAHQLTQAGFTAAHREEMSRWMDSTWETCVAGVAAARGIAAKRLQTLADRGPLLASEAVDAGLVERLAFWDEVVKDVKGRATNGKGRATNGKGKPARLLYLGLYKRRAGRGRPPGRGRPTTVALLTATGEITRRPRLGLDGRPAMAADRVAPLLRKVAKDKRVKALVLRVDSPGGSAVASETIWREVANVKKAGKPVVVSMGRVAASGGYYISCGADRIVAQPATVTGSIGVILAKPVVAGTKSRAGVGVESLATAANANMSSVNRRYDKLGWKRVRAALDEIYDQFTAHVAEGRGLSREAVHEVARGRVWTGADAKEQGLVDELGGVSRAIELAKLAAGAPADGRVVVKELPRKPTILSRLRPRTRGESSDDPRVATDPVPLLEGLENMAASVAPALRSLGLLAAVLDSEATLHLGVDPSMFGLA